MQQEEAERVALAWVRERDPLTERYAIRSWREPQYWYVLITRDVRDFGQWAVYLYGDGRIKGYVLR
ncbi:MAG: hypothetical protein ACK47B_27890 [Armatimonadota bacterium]